MCTNDPAWVDFEIAYGKEGIDNGAGALFLNGNVSVFARTVSGDIDLDNATSGTTTIDREITTQHAPWASLSYANNRDFLSARVGCYQYHPTYSFNFVTACLKR